MKVVVFHHASGSPDIGPNLRWFYMANALSDHGVEVVVIGASYFHKYINPPKLNGIVSETNANKFKQVYLKCFRYDGVVGRVLNQVYFGFYSLLYASFNCEMKSADVVVCSSPPPFSIMSAVVVKWRSHAKLVFEVRDLWPKILVELSERKGWGGFKLLSLLEKFAVNKSDAIVSVKPGDIEYFNNEYGYDTANFFYIPNGYAPNHENDVCDLSVYSKLQFSDRMIVGYVGAISDYYRLDDLVQVAERLQDTPVDFVIAGSGRDLISLIEMAKSKCLSNIHFIGRIDKSCVIPLIQKFDICFVGLKDVDSNSYGVSCNKLYEYMYMSKPIIASYRTLFDPVTDAQCGFTCNPGDVHELESRLRLLISDEHMRFQMGKNAYDYFTRNHNFDVIVRKFIEMMMILKNR